MISEMVFGDTDLFSEYLELRDNVSFTLFKTNF